MVLFPPTVSVPPITFEFPTAWDGTVSATEAVGDCALGEKVAVAEPLEPVTTWALPLAVAF